MAVIADFRDGCVAFPAGNRYFVNANLVGYPLLEKVEVQPTRTDMIPKLLNCLGYLQVCIW